MSERDAAYAFGDSAPASERLALVARIFAPSTRSLLARLPARSGRRVLDVGCGPGHTTRLLAEVCGDAHVIGLDRSEVFLAEARRDAGPRGPSFVHADVTTPPLPHAPADVVYARYVLSHLGERAAILRGWFEALVPDGVLVMEEPEWIEAAEDVLRRYLQITSGLMAARGGELYVGRELGAMARALGGRVLHDDIALVSPTAGDVATMFGLNLRAYRDDPWVLVHYDAATLDRIAAGLAAWRTLTDRGWIRWGVRQTIVERSSGLP